MRVAILSAGPSLRKTWRGNFQYCATIAVNSALAVVKTDWLAAGDDVTLRRLGAHRPLVGGWTMEDVARTPPDGWRGVRLLPWNYLPGWVGLDRPANWSIQAAVAGAYSLGATIIDVYGHDMAGELDVTGSTGDSRGEERWQRERPDWAASRLWAANHGLTINEIHAETN